MDTKLLEQLRDEKGLVLVEVYATWCPHCQRMMPIVDDIKALYDGQLKVYQFDIDKYGDLADVLGAKAVPSFFIYKNGEQMWKFTGEMDAATLSGKIQEYLD